MNRNQYYNLKTKFPRLLFSLIFDQDRSGEITESLSCDTDKLIKFMSGNEFPDKKQLKNFCDHFKLSYSTLKTWDVTHINEKDLKKL